MTQWRKSSHTGGANDDVCVEVADLPQGIGIRDSKNPAGGQLTVSRIDFAELVERINGRTS